MTVVGFPKKAISKVIARLEKEKINYLIIDTRNNYDVDNKCDNGNLNKYQTVLEKAHKEINIKRRIDKITEILTKEKDINKIKRIEEIIYESRKV